MAPPLLLALSIIELLELVLARLLHLAGLSVVVHLSVPSKKINLNCPSYENYTTNCILFLMDS